MIPAPAPRFYAYVVVNTEDKTKVDPLAARMSRSEARAFIEELEEKGADVSRLRIRRAKVTLFES